MDITTEDYIYIEAIGLILYYHDIANNVKSKYRNLYIEALKVAYSRESKDISSALLKELVAQEAIAFRINRSDVIKPDIYVRTIFNTIYKYTGEHEVAVVVNIDKKYHYLFNVELSKLVEIFVK